MKKDTTTRKATAEQIAKAKADNAIYRTATARTYGKTTAPAIPETRKDTTKTQNTTADKKNAFSNILRRYENAVTSDTATATEFENALTDLAKAVSYSVLKKCINVSYNKTLEKTRRELTRDIKDLETLDYVTHTATELQYNKNGDLVTVVVDKSANEKYTNLIQLTFGDGLDLLHSAIVEIQEQTAKAFERYGTTLPECWLEKSFNVRRLNRKVWIKTTDNKGGWIDDETTPIREIYKSVRRYIENNRTVNADARNTYVYISELVTDTESNTTETIYTRFPKFADIGGYVTDFNGKPTTYTADETTADDIDTILEKLNLSTQQAKILQLRLCGYGKKAIAKYMGVRDDNIKNQIKRIQKKAVEIGLTANAFETE